MIIDFHTHVWPDTLAPRAISALTGNTEGYCKPVTDGTLKGLFTRMEEWKIDLSIVQPVVTKPTQTRTVNEFAAAINTENNAPWKGKIISFGGFWPYTDDYRHDIDYIASLGLKGIKLHPEYQQFSVADAHFIPMYEYALDKGLILLFHAGEDFAYHPPFHSSPRAFAQVADALKGHTSGAIVIAHLGGLLQWDDAEKYLAGKDVYLDTSLGLSACHSSHFMRICDNHDKKKLLFASDSPWSNAQDEIATLKTLSLPQDTIDDILGNNAARLLELL